MIVGIQDVQSAMTILHKRPRVMGVPCVSSTVAPQVNQLSLDREFLDAMVPKLADEDVASSV